ncbi:hypothetical protein [Formosa sp. A9]
MAKLYSKTSNEIDLNPKADTIKFLLDYSKALRIVHCKAQEGVKLILN